MPQSPLLASFDPFATHPFTNGSGVPPRPPLPSSYPVPIPSRQAQPYYGGTITQYPPLSSSASSTSSSQSSTPLRAPRPQRANSPMTPARPIFVPFRKDASSPDLVLKKSPKQFTK
ncbi:unnamed protein product [Cyclocybe aegerita]|uniref:Uncharacterized protein n=1 Tax=Cyclocybe aegerita TaxID=1973307 RepID=A0A8S0WLN6_CYCAE|nr:unnamed protein product [Cyclocybe aegerita]